MRQKTYKALEAFAGPFYLLKRNRGIVAVLTRPFFGPKADYMPNVLEDR